MPRPISPPPPQPSLEETAPAVRFLSRVILSMLGFFLLVASTYRYDAPMVDYGREDGQSWNIWRARRLKEGSLRQHEGGRIAWMIGSSVLRDSFDEELINEGLAARGSPWRVAKFGMPRGAAGMVVGLLDELPVRPGDRVIHSVAMDNLRRDWIHHVKIPEDRLARLLSPAEMWSIEEYSLQERLEQAVAVPRDFYRYHEPYMLGLGRWFSALWWLEAPKKKKPKYYLGFRKLNTGAWLEWNRERGEEDNNFFPVADMDLSASQFNVHGLAQMRAAVGAAGAELVLLDIPYRQEYQLLFQEEGVRRTWDDWRAAQPELCYFPQLPEDHYYDLRHPNHGGREALTRYLIDWMTSTPRGRPTALTWTPETP